jgi:Tfp pilus assembly protein PilW
MKKQFGITLIELMISMMLGLGLVAGVGQLFVQSQKSFRLQQNLSDMTDDATFILESLAKGLLLAGYSDGGDTNFGSDTTAVLGSSPTLAFSNCYTDTATNVTRCEVIKGDDNSLIYRYRYGSNPYGSSTNSDTADSLNNFIGTSSLAGTANKDDMVQVYIYKKDDTDGIPVLYCRVATYTPPATAPSSTPNAQPLISEVENLVFKYGIHDKTTNTFYYTTASNITDWTQVFAVKIFLVMRSADENLTHNQTTYKIEGVAQPLTALSDNKKRLYKVFSKTVFLRAIDH